MAGIYEQIINQLFRCKLDKYDRKIYHIGMKEIGRDEAVLYLSRYLYALIQNVIDEAAQQENGVEKCIQFTNDVIKELGQKFCIENYEDDLVDASHSILTSIINKSKCNYPDLHKYIQRITPLTSLTKSSLFTGAKNSVNMISELRKEILSADKIYIVVSFIRMSGLNLMLPELKEFVARGGVLKVITTTYMHVTEYRAIEKLAKLLHVEIKISYNMAEDRLHAKAYVFLRESGFHTAYIGSSNISHPALTEGMEWNVKVTQMELPHIFATVKNTFEAYWEQDSFELFDLERDADKLRRALRDNEAINVGIDYTVLDLIQAKEYQNDILDRLEKERRYHNNWRNLVVAATGTGKTVIAAFDYKRFRENNPRAHFLFVVHREEIIKQACATYRAVLGDPNFGDMWYGGHEVSSFSYLFASKDLLNNRLDKLQLPDDYYDYIVFDEAHHIVAETYQKILNKFKPKVLLGLTATPERMDNSDITQYFNNQISAEIRLDTALNNRLLAPFHYFGITDSVDLSEVKWERGRFVASELTKIYTNNDLRTSIIFKSLEKYLPDYNDVRALCFCVDQQHANYMNAKFTLAGLKSAVLTSENAKYRNVEIKRLAEKKINYLFVVDMFNEGIDIPTIDTVLFLRPTESLTVFLQQFGRGLRKSKNKEYLTVLDFVGHSRAEFNYMDRFRALMGKTSMSVKEEVERDFPHLPLGCTIQLEPKAKEYIIQNITGYINSFKKRRIIQTIQGFGQKFNEPLSLSNFLRLTHVPLEKIYNGTTWNSLCYSASVASKESSLNVELSRAVSKKWLSTDSYTYFSFIHDLAKRHFVVSEGLLTPKERKMSLMLYYDLYISPGEYRSLQQMFNRFSQDEIFIDEVCQVTEVLMSRCNALELEDNSVFKDSFPLCLHGVYTKAQIQVAIETSTLSKMSSSREGCERNIIKGIPMEAMFVDVIKDREEGSNTDYKDFAQSDVKFHWETQNSVKQQSPTGQSYIKGLREMLLFVRKQRNAAENKYRTLGYVYLGKVTLESYDGNKPMQIVWKLKTPMPGAVYEYAATLANA